jgi:glycosyltransferase involved in cell wall biosynthesis
MQLRLRLLFATGHEYLPQRVGGSELSTHDLCDSLAQAGASVGVLARVRPSGWLHTRTRLARRLLNRQAARDMLMDYPVFRAGDPGTAVLEVLQRFRPDVVIVHPDRAGAILKTLVAARQPTLVYLRDVEFQHLEAGLPDTDTVGYVANSTFVRDAARAAYGIEPTVIPPLIIKDRYWTAGTGDEVLFVNPVSEKGVEMAFAIAALCPERRFRFIECWPLRDDERIALRRRAEAAGNVVIQGTTRDMRSVYARARVVIVPSQWQEAWGRVVTEAQVSGIPVLASDVGGLPESVGRGGILFSPSDGASAWAATIERLYADDAHYQSLARQARDRAAEPDLAPDTLVTGLLKAIRLVAASAKT